MAEGCDWAGTQGEIYPCRTAALGLFRNERVSFQGGSLPFLKTHSFAAGEARAAAHALNLGNDAARLRP